MPGNFTFYTTEISDTEAFFDESEAGHAIRTLRYKNGDKVKFTDGLGNYYDGVVKESGKKEFSVTIENKSTSTRKSEISLFVGMLKSMDRMEWLVEKATELGVKTVLFVNTGNAERTRINTEKLRKSAIAAMKQSHQCWLPDTGAVSWSEMLQIADGSKYIGHISGKPLAEVYKKGPLSLLIGPEGDFTSAELSQAIHAGFVPFGLGSSVLRAETAAVASVSFCSLSDV